MPEVNGKKFPYTTSGVKSAKKAVMKKAVKKMAMKGSKEKDLKMGGKELSPVGKFSFLGKK